MRKSDIKDVIRRTFRNKYGFSPHPLDITIKEYQIDEDNYLHATIAVSERTMHQGCEEYGPEKHYQLEYDGLDIEEINC